MTTSIELSKQLYEVGLKIETEKWWCDKFPFICSEPIIIDLKTKEQWRTTGNGGGALSFEQPAINALMTHIFPAYQTDELLVVMPEWYKIRKAHNRYYCMADGLNPDEHPMITEDINPSECIGKMCLWLLSNGFCYNPETKMIEEEK